MSAGKTLDRPYPGLLDWLHSHNVEYEIHAHDPAFTARATAKAEGVDPRTFAKVVGLSVHRDRNVLVVLDATDQVDLEKARRLFGGTEVRLLTEAELTALAPDCPAGALPAVGALLGLATFADYAVREDAAISFNAGSHTFSVRVERAAWEHASGVVYADLAADTDTGPVWSRS